ncbi:MAG: AmmeMemoRadiSam system protein B [Planctomycetota bacterium]|nr:AmmeMemoRadiSam system protein B [Planctomycetota bacterium]
MSIPEDLSEASMGTIRRAMDIPSRNSKVRGQKDGIGFARNLKQMEELWKRGGESPKPQLLTKPPKSKIVASIFPHDDHLYAGRVYRQLTPWVQSKTVLLFGVFHSYARFKTRDKLVFGPYQTWRSPSGPIQVSPHRDLLLSLLSGDSYIQDPRMIDQEHSLETIVYWLKFQNPALNIIPILIPAMNLKVMKSLSRQLACAVQKLLQEQNWTLGGDLSVVVSADAIHYGSDFKQTRFGPGGLKAYQSATKLDRDILFKFLAKRVSKRKIKRLFGTFVDPKDVDTYRWTWCGRFSVPFGLSFMRQLLKRDGKQLFGHPLYYETSISLPRLALQSTRLGLTAPADLYHFVGYPGLVYTSI